MMFTVVVVFVALFSSTYTGYLTNAQVHDLTSNFIFANYEIMGDGKILEKNGTSLRNLTTKDKNNCLLECTKQDKCLSINLLVFDKPSQVQCELLNWGGTAFHGYLKSRPNSYSMQKLGVCTPNPCKNDGECVANVDGQPYLCICSKNYTGKNCEKTGCVLFDFENGIADWTRTGTAFDNQPTYGDNSFARNGAAYAANPRGDWYIGTYENRPSSLHTAGAFQYDAPTGTMTSTPFFIRGTSIKFLIGGGSDINLERIELLIGGNVVAKASSATDNEALNPRSFDMTNYQGSVAQIRIVDEGTESWNHINVDHIEDSFCSE